VYDVKNLNKILSLNPHLLKIAPHNSFGQIIRKINKSKKLEFVFVKKPSSVQMLAVILARIFGKKIFWIQNFENPPVPNFFSRLLLPETDLILVQNRKQANKLKSFGIKKSKIKILN